MAILGGKVSDKIRDSKFGGKVDTMLVGGMAYTCLRAWGQDWGEPLRRGHLATCRDMLAEAKSAGTTSFCLPIMWSPLNSQRRRGIHCGGDIPMA